MSDPIRPRYDALGVEGFYARHGSDYANPHAEIVASLIETVVREATLDLSHVLDLAAGAGEATLPLRTLGATRIDAFDPFTAAAYERATGNACEPIRFEDIAAGLLGSRRWSLVVCSFALHLCEGSRLAAVCVELARRAPTLLVVTPHKRPQLRDAWGWTLRREWTHDRVRARLYESTLFEG